MRVNKWNLMILLCSVGIWGVNATNDKEKIPDITEGRVLYSGFPEHEKYPVKVSKGPFVKKLQLTEKEKKNSAKWKKKLQQELAKPVNFSGHYRLYINHDEIYEKECIGDSWVCGWVIDKHTGKIVAELPEFNYSRAYHVYTDNGSPVPDDLVVEFYPNSSIIYIYGENIPYKEDVPRGEKAEMKCGNIYWEFKNDKYEQLFFAECEDKFEEG